MSLPLLIAGVVAALMGGLLLSGSLWPTRRWDSWWERSWAIVSGAGWFAVGAFFLAAALTSGDARTVLLIAGAAAGVITGAARWLIHDRGQARQIRRPGES